MAQETATPQRVASLADTLNPAGEAWTSASQKYLGFMHSITTEATSHLVRETAAVSPFTASSRVLDNGCGSGSLTASISHECPSTPILATDISQGMLDLLDTKNLPNVRTRTADAMDLSLLGDKEGEDGADERYSHVLSSFMIQFAPEPWTPVKEMFRLLQKGGVLGLATWGAIDYFEVIKKVGFQLDPSITFKLGMSMEWPHDVASIEKSLVNVGFIDVKVWQMQMEVPQSYEAAIEYAFEGGNPTAEAFLKPWRDTGKVDLLKSEVLKARTASDRRLGISVLLAVAKKP